MSTMYKCKDRVSYSRIDTEGKLKEYAIVNAMQDCSLFHSEDVGLSCMDLKSEDAHAWLVNSWDIVIKRRPIMGEVFEVSTWPYKMRGVFGMRNFVMKTEEGETLAYADSHWFFFDQKTGTPVKPEPEDYEAYGMEEPYPMEYKPRKIKIPENLVYCDSITVCENHMDTNSHMNNGEYVRLAADHLPFGFEVEELRVEYRLAAKLGDEIQCYTCEQEEGFYVVMTDKEKSPFAITCFKGRIEERE